MKKILKILAIVLLTMNLSGCWNRTELNALGIVLGIAVDDTDQPDQIEMTAQLVNAAEMENSSTSPYINLTATGTDVMNIFRGFTHEVSRKLYIPHNQVLIFGEDKAKKGVHDTLDFFLRDHEARLTIQILVAKGKGGDMLDYEPHFSNLPSTDIFQILKAQKATSKTPELMLFDLMQCLTNKNCCALAPVIELVEKEDEKSVRVAGSAVFKEDKMIGELDTTETRGVLWVKNKIKSGVLRVKVKDQDVNLEIVSAGAKFEPVYEDDGSIRMKIELDSWNKIASFTGSRDISTKENVELLKEEIKKEITSEIEAAFEKSKQLKCDVFEFGNSIQKNDPKKWKSLEDSWKEIYSKIKLDVEIKVTITGLGRLAQPDYPKSEIQR